MQLLFVVRRDDNQRPVSRGHGLLRLVDVELHPVELAQEVIGKLDVSLVDLVDEDNGRRLAFERLPKHAALDVVADIPDAAVAQLRIAQAGDGVVFVKSLLRFRRRLDVPLVERSAERAGDLLGKERLARTRLPFDQQRAREGERRVDRELQVVGRNVRRRSFEPHGISARKTRSDRC
jgi:hypothetical protein